MYLNLNVFAAAMCKYNMVHKEAEPMNACSQRQ